MEGFYSSSSFIMVNYLSILDLVLFQWNSKIAILLLKEGAESIGLFKGVGF